MSGEGLLPAQVSVPPPLGCRGRCWWGSSWLGGCFRSAPQTQNPGSQSNWRNRNTAAGGKDLETLVTSRAEGLRSVLLPLQGGTAKSSLNVS